MPVCVHVWGEESKNGTQIGGTGIGKEAMKGVCPMCVRVRDRGRESSDVSWEAGECSGKENQHWAVYSKLLPGLGWLAGSFTEKPLQSTVLPPGSVTEQFKSPAHRSTASMGVVRYNKVGLA